MELAPSGHTEGQRAVTRYSIDDFIENLRRQNAWYRADGAAPGDAPPRRAVDGVNVCGYLRDESGLGAAARGYVRAIRALGMPVALKDLSGLSSNRSGDRTLGGFAPDQPYRVNLMC